MEARFEPDLIELSGDGSYLMLCADRKMLFHEGDTSGKRPLSEVAGARVEGDELVVELEDGGALRCRFASSSSEELVDAARRLAAGVKAWR